MTWSLRNQLLLPLVVFVGLLALTISYDQAALQVKTASDRAVQIYNDLAATLATAAPSDAGRLLTTWQTRYPGWHFVIINDGHLAAGTVTLPARQQEILKAMPPASQQQAGHDAVLMGFGGHWYYVIPIVVTGWPADSYLICLEPYQSIAATVTSVYRQSSWIAFGISSLLIAAAAVYSGRLSRRVVRIEQQVKRIATGDMSQMADERGSDEISELAHSVNGMAAELESMKRLVAQTERQRLHTQLAGGVAHELRNGIHAARLSLEVFQEACESHAMPAMKMLTNAHDQLAVTETLVRRLLSLGKPQQLGAVPQSLSEVLNGVVNMMEPVCRHAEIQFQVEINPQIRCDVADSESLQAAIVNLCLNGIEAIGRQGTLGLSVHQSTNEVVIDVSDSGPGPESAVAEQIFEPFVTTKPEGIGLGLAQVQQAVRSAGGDVRWTRANGQTHFVIRLPAVLETTPEKSRPASVPTA